MPKRKDYPFPYTFLKAHTMPKKYSIGFYTGGVKVDEWDELSKKKKTIALSKAWYVRWSYRNPLTGKLERKNNLHGGVNSFKTKKERLKILKYIKKNLIKVLKNGHTPFNEKEVINIGQKEKETSTSVKEAIDAALEIAKSTVTPNTYNNYKKSAYKFLNFLGKHNQSKDIKLVTRKILIAYLNKVLKNTSARTRNNYRTDLSAVFTILEKKLLLIDYNFIKNIEKEKVKHKRNRTLSNKQLIQITDFLKVNDPVVLLVIRFVAYNFLRPVEVCRLKIKDLNLEEALLYYQAKNKPLKTKRIPSLLLNDLKKMNLHNYDKNSFLITPSGIPGEWEGSDNQRRGVITRRFTRLKSQMVQEGIELEKGDNIYSFRHSYITNLFRHLRTKENLSFYQAIQQLMPITGHSSESGLMNYIHAIDADIPEDWSEKIDVII